MIYIPTLTSKLRNLKNRNKEYAYVLYSPNPKLDIVFKGKEITIWDNYTYYLKTKLKSPNKQEIAKQHYIWLINFIINNYEEGITLITPDVDWIQDGEDIELLWNEYCSQYPQLYVPNTWKTSTEKLNIVGHGLRNNTPKEYYHKDWNHCFTHIRTDINSPLVTYDASCEIIPHSVLN